MSAGDPKAYWEARLGERFSVEGVGYQGLGAAFNDWMYRARRRLFLHHVGPHVAPGPKVLDVGSGTGFYVDRWEELGAASITGSDLTAVAVTALAERYPRHEFVELDIGDAELPLAGRSFDAVSACDVLFHIVDDERYRQAFRNAASLLRPGGIFVFTDNFLHAPAPRASTQVSRTLDEAERAVADAGIEVVTRRPALVLLNAPVDSKSRAHHAFWRGLARLASAAEPAGWAAGALLYPLDVSLGRLLREGPTTELMICRRP